MRILAIGDIHGCNTSLVRLLSEAQLSSADKIVFLGDYIDRGPASREVIGTLPGLNQICSPIFLRGNHEVMILEAREDSLKSQLWQSYGGLETAFSYGADFSEEWASSIPQARWDFLEQTRRFHETAQHIFVHACLDPELDMEEQPDWLLFWEYFESIKPHKSKKCVVCGHTPQKSGQIKNAGFAVCIDTAPALGGWLTCLDVNSGKFWQANEKGNSREGEISRPSRQSSAIRKT